MNPPKNSSRFRSQVRHYHRHRSDNPSSWDSWVGIDPSIARRRRKRWKWTLVAASIASFVGILATVAYQMG